MKPEEKDALEKSGSSFRPIASGELKFTSDAWEGSGHTALSVKAASPSIDRSNPTLIQTTTGSPLGFFLPLRGKNIEEPGQLSDLEYICYISEVEATEFGKPYTFRRDYVAVETSRRLEYETSYLLNSSIWGGFFHEDKRVTATTSAYIRKPRALEARALKPLPTPYHESAGLRSVHQAYAFERFLKLYHMLELLFDWDLVQKIKALGQDLEGIGKLLSSHKAKELQTFASIIEWRCDNYDRIASKLADIKPYAALAQKVFFEFDKDGNPINEAFFQSHFISGTFDRSINPKQLSNKSFEQMTRQITAYWLYRIRCSIAHQRIGEFVFSELDEEFVVEFAEPLIREVLCQAFD